MVLTGRLPMGRFSRGFWRCGMCPPSSIGTSLGRGYPWNGPELKSSPINPQVVDATMTSSVIARWPYAWILEGLQGEVVWYQHQVHAKEIKEKEREERPCLRLVTLDPWRGMVGCPTQPFWLRFQPSIQRLTQKVFEKKITIKLFGW